MRHVELTAANDAVALQPLVELALHLPPVDIRVRLGELVVQHPVAEVLDEELLLGVGLVVVEALRLRAVLEQEPLGCIDAGHVGERGGGQVKPAHRLLLPHAGAIGPVLLQLLLELPLQRHEPRLELSDHLVLVELLGRLYLVLDQPDAADQLVLLRLGVAPGAQWVAAQGTGHIQGASRVATLV